MRRISFSVLFLACAPFAFGANKEMIELQRDVAQLQDQMRTLQQTLDQRVGSLQAMTQQALDASNRTNTALAVMQDRFNDALKQQQASVSAPVANLGNKLDQMSEDFRAVREAVLDMTQRMGKIDAKLADLSNTVNVIRSPVAPPPSGNPFPPTGGGSASLPPGSPMPSATPSMPPTTGGAPPPGMSADTSYSNAVRDYNGGQYDLAMQEFGDYVKYYPTTQFAPNSQFYIGEIYMRRKDYENAIQAFDSVLEHYTDNPKTAASHLRKGEALVALGRRDAAAREFRDILSHPAPTEVTAKAKADMRDLGLAAGAAPAPVRRRTR